MYTLPPLSYDYNALEPYIDETTMRIHHTKHHQAYIDKLNAALEGHADLAKKDVHDLISDLNKIPKDIQAAVRNHGGGHANHTMFWMIMGPAGQKKPSGKFGSAIEKTFGSFEKFQEEFKNAAITQFGSGWAWLVLDTSGNLKVTKTPNQDSPVSDGLRPILGLDVWEHAYYLKYQNRRPEYIDAWWNVLNWKQIEKNFKDVS